MIECITGEMGSEAINTDVRIYSGQVQFPTMNYNYSLSSTPTITDFSMYNGIPGDVLTLYGSILDTNITNFNIQLGNLDCNITNISNTTLQIQIPELPGGTNYPLHIHSALYGYAVIEFNSFSVDLGISSISPSQGSKGGGTILTLNGFGFDVSGLLSVYICDYECQIQDSILTDTIKCVTPVDYSLENETACNVNISQLQGTAMAQSPVNFTYSVSLTPMLKSILPNFGGSGGGTRINITGQVFFKQ